VSQAEENVSGAASDEADIAGQNSQSFDNGSLAYVVSNVCASEGVSDPAGKGAQCQAWTQEIQVVDYSTGDRDRDKDWRPGECRTLERACGSLLF